MAWELGSTFSETLDIDKLEYEYFMQFNAGFN